MTEDLSQLWNATDALIEVAAVHEAGHACIAVEMGGVNGAPVFSSVSIESSPNEHGVVPGGVAINPQWFERRSAVDRGAILLAGWYAQEAHRLDAESGREFRDAALEKLNDNSDCTDDIGRVLEIEPHDDQDVDAFWGSVLERLSQLWVQARPRIDLVAAALATRRTLSWRDFLIVVGEESDE